MTMQSGPRVSVLIPVFNTMKYLELALRSISAQEFRDFEMVVIDDGSSDGSAAFLQEYARQEPRMRLVTRPNQGLIVTRNELLGLARGELVAWMDSDDVSWPERLRRQVEAFDADPELLCIGSFAQCIDPDGNSLELERYPLLHGEIVEHQLKYGGGMRFPTTMMKRQQALEVGGFRTPFLMGEDLDLLMRLGERGRLANLPDILYRYRQHLSSVCAALGPQWQAYRSKILDLARERRETGQDALQRGQTLTIERSAPVDARAQRQRAYSHWAWFAMVHQNRRLAWDYTRRALWAKPTANEGWKAMARFVFNRPFGI